MRELQSACMRRWELCFFFSSRRRHTRLQGDWSSDVCSSDLRIAGNLEECAEIVRTIVGHAKLIGPGVEHINETGGVVAGALPPLYGMAEGIVTGVTAHPEPPAVPEPARPVSGTRRSRLLDAVGFRPQP